MSKAKHAFKQQRGKHRKYSRRSKAIAAVGVATATATALTVVGITPPPDTNTAKFPVALMASTGPNYTQLIKDTSNSLDDLLLTGTLTDALNAFLNPLGGALTATAERNDLLTVHGALVALTDVLDRLNDLPDVSDVPGLPPGAGDVLTQNLGPVLAALAALLPLADILDNLSGVPGALDDALAGLNGINTLLNSLLGPESAIGAILALLPVPIPVPQITIPSVTGLVDELFTSLGATATETQYDSTLSWPVLGINGTSNVTNLFAQIPSLTVGTLVDALLSGVVIPNLNSILDPILSNPLLNPLNLPIPEALSNLTGLVNSALLPLDLIATPSVTAWIPSANGLYTLPMGGSFGYLATMPTVDIGPLTVGDATVPLNGADTVVATPILAAGITLPLNLATFGVLTTPGVLFPTATGVSSLGGTTLQSLAVPGLLDSTNLNTGSAFYVGTNGININTGQNAGTLITPSGTLPYEFSLGSFNIGTTGFGYSGPSIAGVNVFPGFQIGTAPVQISDDGLLPADVINAGLTPIQTADAATTVAESRPSAKANPPAAQTLNATLAAPPSETQDIPNVQTSDGVDAPQGDVADASTASKKKRLRFDLGGPKAANETAAPTGTAKHPTPPQDTFNQVGQELKKTADNGGNDIQKPGEGGSGGLGAEKKDGAEDKDKPAA